MVVGEVSDREIIEAAKQCNVDIFKESDLLSRIDELLRLHRRLGEERWEFRVSEHGQGYWTSSKTKASTQRYPHVSRLLEELEESRKSMQSILSSEKYKLTARIPKKIFPYVHDQGAAGLYQQLKEEANKLVSTAILDKANTPTAAPTPTQPLGPPGEDLRPNGSYNLKRLAEYIGQKLTKEEALDILFACPFDLGRDPVEVESISEKDSGSEDDRAPVQPSSVCKRFS